MLRFRKPLLLVGGALLLAGAGLLIHASNGESEFRNQYKAPAPMDYGVVPVDLLEGRTHYEGQNSKGTLFKLDAGPAAQDRVMTARVGCGVAALGAVVLAIRAFTRAKR